LRGLSAYPFYVSGDQGFSSGSSREPDEKGLRWSEARQDFIADFGDLRSDCIEAGHAPTFSGHFGIFRTYEKLQEVFDWPNMQKYVERYIKTCDSCQKVKASKKRKVGLSRTGVPVGLKGYNLISVNSVHRLCTTHYVFKRV
jgi:hypothetical protein